MLEIKLERDLEPTAMQSQPCGICGADFEPKAVLACLVTECFYLPTCEACLSHLALRAEEEPIPAIWNRVYKEYLLALEKYPQPALPPLEALKDSEKIDPRWDEISLMLEV